jgi:hypothetical protein
MSHHFDSAADRADGRINPCDLYAFPAAFGTTALILTVNPDAGRLATTRSTSPSPLSPGRRWETPPSHPRPPGIPLPVRTPAG